MSRNKQYLRYREMPRAELLVRIAEQRGVVAEERAHLGLMESALSERDAGFGVAGAPCTICGHEPHAGGCPYHLTAAVTCGCPGPQ